MNKGIFKRLTFLATAAFMAAIGVLCLGIGFYWFNFIVPSIQSGEKIRAEMVMAQLTEKLEPVLEKKNQSALEDIMVRLLLMKDISSDQNLILGIRVETLDGIRLTQYSKEPIKISGPFALIAPLYSSTTHVVLGEVAFQYNPYFYELLVEDARTKLLWFLALMAGVIFILQRFLLWLLRPLSQLSQSLGKIDFNQSVRLPEIKGMVVSEINEVVQSMKNLLGRLETSRESEQNVREELVRAQSVSHIGNWVWDVVPDKVYWSDEVFRIFGLKPQQFEVTYETFINAVHSDDRAMVEQALEKALAGKAEYDIVHRLVRPDDSLRFVREKSEVTFDENGKPIKFVGTVQDITEQKLAEDLSLRFGRIMDEAFNEIYIIDEQTLKFTRVNQSARQNIGYSMEEMAAMTLHDIAPEMTVEQMDALFQSMRDETESMPMIQSVHRRKDGTDYPVEVRLQLSRHESPPQFVAIVQDITERQKAEQAIQQAMQTLEARVQERTADLERITRENELILNAAGEGICEIDKDGFIIFANPAAKNIMGYEGEECAGKSHHDTCHHKRADGSHYPSHECPIQKTLKDGQARKANDEVFWRKDGTAIPVEYVSNPIHEDGKVIGAVVTFKDITDRKKVEENLRRSEERFRKYFELPLVGIGIISTEKGWLDINDKLCEILGYSQEELKKLTWPELTHLDDREVDIAMFNSTLAGERDGYNRDKRFIHKNGHIVYASISVRVVRDDQGTVEYFIILIQDISDRKKAEAEKHESEKRFHELFSANPDSVLIMDAETQQILEVNQSAIELYGYTREEFLKLTGKDISAEPERTTASMKQVDVGKITRISLRYHKKKDGTVFPLEITGGAFTLNDQRFVFGIIRDISERQKSEQELILAKEVAERANNAKSEFLSQMSHELRTPLNAILGFGQVMESDPEEPLTEFQQQSVNEILKGGGHLLDLINEILDLSRIESGHLTLSLENVNLNLLTEELVTLCDPMAKKSNIELLNFVPLHDDIYIWADRVRLKQILLNLMSNAIKYNKTGGTVKIDATGNKENGICISVTDTGVGIPEDQLDDLFQPFNRLGSESSDIEGTGVGLTITKRLVEKMDGTINVESQLGQGSTFSVTFPIGEKEEAVQSLPQKERVRKISSTPARERWVVLYVEDNPANLNLVRHIFRRRPDVLLLTAPEAKLGIELAEAHRPDLILLDINLPGMDGLTAFKLLQAMEETRNTPVVAISANAMPRDIKNALETGFSDYLTKPLDVPEFNRVIEEQLKISQQRK